MENGNLTGGLRSIESASALDPGSEAIRRLLVTFLLKSAHEALNGLPDGLNRSLAVARRAIELCTEDRPDDNALAPDALLDNAHLTKALAGYWKKVFSAYPQPGSDSKPVIVALQDEYRRFLHHDINQKAIRLVHNENGFKDYTIWFGENLTKYSEPLSATAEEWLTDTVAAYSAWLKLAQKYPLHWDKEATSESTLRGNAEPPAVILYITFRIRMDRASTG